MDDFDLAVVGAGMAGLTAAARLARAGRSVIVVERAPSVGGSALHAGFAWTAANVELLREINPGGDGSLADALISGFPEGIEWIRSLGVQCHPAVQVLRYGRGHQFDTSHYVTRCVEVIRDRGGEILLSARADNLVRDGDAVVGVDIVTADGHERRVRAANTLLATGGFQANPAMRAQLIHAQARDMALRSNPFSAGDGWRLGQAAGAQLGPAHAGFYGHLVPADVPLAPEQYVELALYCSEHALLFNKDGNRFVDETVGDHVSAIALVDQPEARALLVADRIGYEQWMRGSYVAGAPAVDKFEASRRRGARCAVAEDIEEFGYLPADWGYPGLAIADGITRYNHAVTSGLTLAPTRSFDRRPMDQPPYYVIEAAPAITFTMTGILIDSQARVLNGVGRPVSGLLCAGADAGGVYYRAYAGGIAAALVFGLAAARTALDGGTLSSVVDECDSSAVDVSGAEPSVSR
jgi:succinate dehydrogenase/fumarate reductase flavoprotein subunit